MGLLIIRRLIESNAVIVRIPASKLGILQIFIKVAVKSPASEPTSIAIIVAVNGENPLCISTTQTAAPNG